MLETLHQSGFHDINGKDVRWTILGRVPLTYFSEQGNILILKQLLDFGVDINIQQANGSTALLGAVFAKQKDVILFLLSHHASIDLPNNSGETPLMVACWRGFKEEMELLVNNKASLNLKNKKGKTALALMKERIHETQRLSGTTLGRGSYNNYKEMIQFLESHGATE